MIVFGKWSLWVYVAIVAFFIVAAVVVATPVVSIPLLAFAAILAWAYTRNGSS